MSRSNQNQSKSLIEAWELVTRFRWQFILPCFVVCAGVLAASLMLPRKYKAEAIFERRTDLVMEEITSRGASSNYQQPRAGLVQEIAGEPAIDKLLRERAEQLQAIAREEGHRLDLIALRHDLVTKLLIRRDIGTSSLDRVRVSLTTEHPKIAQFVVNALVEDYIAQTRSQLDNRLRESQAFFIGEVERARQTIEELEDARLNFEIEHAGLLPDNPNNVQAALAEAQAQYTTLLEERDEARMQAAALRSTLERMPETIPSFVTKQNPELERLNAKLGELRAQLQQYTAVFKMTDRHPDLIDLRQQIIDVEAAIAQTPAEVVSEKRFDTNPQYAQVQVVVTQAVAAAEALDKQVASLENRIAQLDQASAGLFPVRAEYKKMEREIDQAMRQLSFWDGNLNRVNMSLTAEDGNRGVKLDFIRPCGELTLPVSPDLIHVLMAAIGMGLMAGTVSVLLAHRTNESFNTGEQLSHAMGIPLVGSVSEIISVQQRRMRRLKNYILYPMNVAGMSAVMLLMAGMLYINLKRPELYSRLIDNPQAVIRAQLGGDAETALQD